MDAIETETLARLYMEQGAFDRALPVFEQLLRENPGLESAKTGLAKCRAAMSEKDQEAVMSSAKRLEILKSMLERLTSDVLPAAAAPRLKTQPAPVTMETPAEPDDGQVEMSEIQTQPSMPRPEITSMPAPAIPSEGGGTRLEILQAMLQRLTG